MKIGIYDDGTINNRGGGFTFKYEFLNGIANADIDSEDTFFVFSWAKNGLRKFDFRNIEILYINEPCALRILESVKRFIHKQLKRSLLFLRKENRETIINPSVNAFNLFSKIRSKILEKKLLSFGADLIIYTEAQEVLTYNIPFICISWDIAHRYSPFFPETNFQTWEKNEKVKPKALQRAVHLAVGTEIGKKQIHSQYRVPLDRISVVPFPTPIYLLAQKCNSLRTPNGFDPEKDFLFYPSSYWPHKNHYILVEAMKRLVQDHELDIQLVLCGSDKGNKRYINKLISKYQLNDRILMFDFLERSEVNYLYQKALALVFPTHIGPDNLPPMEAFGLGCPVIASSVIGAEEQLDNHALLFDPFDVEDLLEKILQIKEDEALRNDLIQRGLKKARSWTSDDYAKLLLSLVERYRPYHNCFDLKSYRTMFA